MKKLLFIFFAVPVFASTHRVICIPDKYLLNPYQECKPPNGCLYENTTSFTGWGSEGSLCPEWIVKSFKSINGYYTCMFQFWDSAMNKPRSVYWPDCTCDGSHIAVGDPKSPCTEDLVHKSLFQKILFWK